MSGRKIIAGLKDALKHAKTRRGAKVTRHRVKSSREIIEETAREYRGALRRLAKK